MANIGERIADTFDTIASTATSRIGSALGSYFGPAGTAVGGIIGSIAGKSIKFILLAIVGAVIIVVGVSVFFLTVLIPIILGIDLSGPSRPRETKLCSPIDSTFNEPVIIQRVNANMPVYKAAAAEKNIPWEMLAAVHYEESNNDASAPNMYRFSSPPSNVDVNNFVEATKYAGDFLQQKALEVVGRPLRANMDPENPNDEQSIKDAFWGYNGRADYQRDIAESLGFDQGYEGSFYVMNNWDEDRIGLRIIGTDRDESGNTIHIDQPATRDGAWKVFILLRNASYEGGQISQINESCPSVGEGDVGADTPSGCPIVGQIMTPYGFNIGDYVGDRFHHGVDISAGGGTPIKSTISGTAVPGGGEGEPGGYRVSVTNSQYSVGFSHVRPSGRVSGVVTKGQTVAIEGRTGTSVTGPHVHYTVKKGGVEQNPLNYISADLNFTPPADNNYLGIVPTGGVWGQCTALPR